MLNQLETMNMNKNAKTVKTVKTGNVDTVMDFLTRAIIVQRECAADAAAVADKRGGAYTLYVKAAIEAGKAEILSKASDVIFAKIRKDGSLVGANGQPASLNCKQGEDGYVIPSAISAAKSYLVSALSMGLTLVGVKGEPLSYNAIRNAVNAVNAKAKEAKETEKEAERVAALVGIEKTRYEAGKLLAALSDTVAKEENHKDLVDLLDRVQVALNDYGFVSENDSETVGEADIAELVVAAKAPKAVTRKGAVKRAAAH